MPRGEDGQALVEAALVLPSMVLLLLGLVQLTLIQHARIAAEYAAFAAARAGVVMNGDPAKRRAAAAIAVLPAFSDARSLPAMARSLLRLRGEEAALAPFGIEPMRVEVHSPVAADFPRYGQHLAGQELDFDDVRPDAAEATLLSLRVRYLYELKVPFANQAVHKAWLLARMAAGDGASVAPLAAAARAHRYFVPLSAFQTMRMQSNPYRKWAGK